MTACATGAPALDTVDGISAGDGVEVTPSESMEPVAPAELRQASGVKPAQVFGGDCEALFSSDDVGNALGMAVGNFDAYRTVDIASLYVQQFGGIECAWGNANFETTVVVVALPEDAVTYHATSACDVSIESGQTGCALEAVHGGIRISGAVFRSDNDTSALISAQTELLDLFAENATAANAAPLLLPAAGAWAWPLDCESVVAAGDFSAVPGLGATVSGGQSGGTDAYFPGAQIQLLGGYGLPYCGVWTDAASVDFSALGGARWAEADVTALPGATVTVVEGIDVVVVSPTEWGMTRVDAFDGPNWVTFHVKHASNAGSMAQALVAALDTTAVN